MQKFIYEIANRILMNEVERDLLKFIKKKKRVFFDVGCYSGNFTSNLIRFNNKNTTSKYYLFDPNPKSKEYCRQILKNTNTNFFQLALDNSNKKKKFVINRYFEASGSSLNSAHKKDKLYNLTRKVFFKCFQPFNKIKDYEEIEVQTQTLDNFCRIKKIKRIDLLKLDTEGTEDKILLGAKKLLSRKKIDLIYTEVSGFKKTFNKKFNKIVRLLSQYNFELVKTWEIKSLGWLSNLKATDNLFVRK
jgi:FkbM family methyltransferase